jgi:hypothetical protein
VGFLVFPSLFLTTTTTTTPSPPPSQVTAATLLAVLLGDQGTVDRVAPNSTRRVLASGPTDRLFLFFVDHGAPGLVG